MNLQIPGSIKWLKEACTLLTLCFCFSTAVIGQSNVDRLIRTLESSGQNERIAAIRKLSRVKTNRAVGPMIALLRNRQEDPHVREEAAWALGKIKDSRAVEPLITILVDRHEDFRVRRAAAVAIGSIKDERAVGPLITVLGDARCIPSVRERAAYALGETKDARAVVPLITALGDPVVQYGVEKALVKINGGRVLELLIAALHDQGKYVRSGAAWALGDIKDDRAVEPLIVALGDSDSNVRVRAAEALGKIKDSRALEPLIAVFRDENPYVRNAAANSVGEMKDRRVLEPLITALRNDTDDATRSGAARALGKIGGEPASHSLTAAWEAGDLAAVAGACEFFVRRGVPGTEPMLVKALFEHGDEQMALCLLNSGNPQLREAAQKWASQHGYMIHTVPVFGEKGARWGNRR